MILLMTMAMSHSCLTSVAPSPCHVAHVSNLVKGLVVSEILVFLYLYVLFLRNTQLNFNLKTYRHDLLKMTFLN